MAGEMTLDEAGAILRRNGLDAMDVAYVGTTSRIALARRLRALERVVSEAKALDAEILAMRRLLMSGGHTGEQFDAQAARQDEALVSLRTALAALESEVAGGR